jgi:hypothetical protein
VQAVGALLTWDRGVLVVRRGGGGGKRWGSGSPKWWEPSPPRPEPQKRQRKRCLGGRRSARRQATYERSDAHRGTAGARRGDGRGCGGGHTGGGDNVRRAPEEKEKGIFLPEVSDCFPSSAFLDWPGPKFLVFVLAGWRPPCLLSRLPRC